MWLIQCLIGGTRLVYSLPAYGILGLAGVASVFFLKNARPKPSFACLGVSTVFFAYILGRALTSPIGYLAWTDLFMVLACLVIYLLTALYITEVRDRMILLGGLLALAGLEIFFGLKQFAQADNWMPFDFVRANNAWRASGTFISSIHFAGYLEAVGVFALSLARWSTWKPGARWLVGYIGALCYAGVAISGSRGGYLSTAFSLIVFAVVCSWVIRRVQPTRFGRAMAITAAVIVIGLVAAVFFMQRNDAIRHRLNLVGKLMDRSGSDSSYDIRVYNWQAALDQFRVSPVVGTGAGTHLYYGRLFRRPQLQGDPEHAHSDYLELLAEYGLIGAAGMAMFLFVHIAASLRATAALTRMPVRSEYDVFHDNRLALQIGALGAIAAYLAHSVVDFNLHVPGNALLFAFIFGLTANPMGEQAPADKSAAGARIFQLALPALALWLLVQGMPKYPSERAAEQARLALRRMDYPLAIKLAQEGIRTEPNNPFLYFHLGEANRVYASIVPVHYARRPLLEAALVAYNQALDLYPQDENFWVRKGQVLDGLKRFSEAEEAYLNAINLDPNLGVLYAFYSAHLNARGQHDLADEQLAKGKKLTIQDLEPLSRSTLPPP